jgi:hypothetical protein
MDVPASRSYILRSAGNQLSQANQVKRVRSITEQTNGPHYWSYCPYSGRTENSHLHCHRITPLENRLVGSIVSSACREAPAQTGDRNRAGDNFTSYDSH